MSANLPNEVSSYSEKQNLNLNKEIHSMETGYYKVPFDNKDEVKEKGRIKRVSMKNTAIAYNPYSLDSLLGAALAATYLKDYETARLIAYNPFNPIDVLLPYNHIFFVGVEVGKLDFTRLMANEDVTIASTCYRDGYDWLTTKIKSAHCGGESPRFTLHSPIDDFYSELLARTDNTATRIVHFMIQEEHTPITQPYLVDKDHGLIALVSRMVSHSYPIMPFTYVLNERVSDLDAELLNKARVYDATNKLRIVLGSTNPRQELKDMKIEAKTEAYLAHFRQVRYTMNRSLSMRTYRMDVGDKRTIQLPVVQANELIHTDILNATLQNYNEVVTYEDVGAYRIYRICAPTYLDRLQLANIFKPVMTWSEGVVLGVLTHLERQS